MDALKTVVKSIVVSCPYNMTVDQLQNDYKEIEGHVLPYRIFGYHSPHEMLRHEMRDVVQVHGFGAKALIAPVNTAKCDHIAKLVLEQKNTRNRRRKGPRKNRSITVCSRNNNASLESFSWSNSNVKNAFRTRSSKYQHRPSSKADRLSSVKEEAISLEDFKRSTELNEPINSSRLTGNYMRSVGIREMNTSGDLKRSSKIIESINRPQCSINNNTQREVTAISDGKPLVKTVNNRDIVLNILRTYQNEITEKEEVPQIVVSTLANKAEIGAIEKDRDHDKQIISQTEIDELEVSFSALKILDRVEKDQFLEVSELLTCTQGLSDTDSSSSCSDIFYKPKEDKRRKDLDDAIPNFAFNNRIFMLDFPDFTVKFGMKIKPFQMPIDITVDTIISIYIAEIHNPYRFWFHMNRESSDLDELMLKIEIFYAPMKFTLDYAIIRELIQPGQVCAAVYNGFWHRAEILSNIIIDNTVKVFFMDYGTVSDVDITALKYLRTEFAELPAFAFRGCLAEISPVRLHWSTASSLKLLSMSYERLVYAKVCEIDLENRVYYLTVCDTHEGKVIHLNRELILAKEAFKSYEWSKCKQLGTPRLRHKREDYPSFDMLEAGEYPTLGEIMSMEGNGILYESMTDKMIYHPHILNFDENYSNILRTLPYYLLSNNPFASDIISELGGKPSTNKTENVL